MEKLNLSEKNLPKSGTVEQLTKQLEAEKLLLETKKQQTTLIKQTSEQIELKKESETEHSQILNQINSAKQHLNRLNLNIETLKATEIEVSQAYEISTKNHQIAKQNYLTFKQQVETLKTDLASQEKVERYFNSGNSVEEQFEPRSGNLESESDDFPTTN